MTEHTRKPMENSISRWLKIPDQFVNFSQVSTILRKSKGKERADSVERICALIFDGFLKIIQQFLAAENGGSSKFPYSGTRRSYLVSLYGVGPSSFFTRM